MTHDYESFYSRNIFLIGFEKTAVFSPKEALVIAKDPEMATGSELPVHFRSTLKTRKDPMCRQKCQI